MYDLQCLPIFTDVLPDGEIRQRIYTIAQEHNLSYYDASYLELAHRYNLSLKTYDEDLVNAFYNWTTTKKARAPGIFFI